MSTDTFGTEAEHTDDVETVEAGAKDADTGESGAARGDGSSGDESGADEGGEGSTGENSGSSRRNALEAEGDIAADFLEALLDICDIVGDIDVDVDGDRAAVSLVDSEDGRVPRRLVGPDGKVLEALQELTRLAVQSETGQRSRLMLDVAGHRAARRADIVEVARGVIGEVKESGNQVELEPMTAFERKIVHDEVLAAGLRSESDGVEPHRFVVVMPAE
ncbi:MAG: R3H domain-containing nucleic acid-binding protein [Dermatophilaceae bacterium]